MPTFRQQLALLAVTAVLSFNLAPPAVAAVRHNTGVFSGAKVNGGSATHTVEMGKHVLTLSPDFVVPDTPDPHWQVVDTMGNVYLLQRLPIKGDKVNRTITVPTYVKSIAKVQIYSAWAEVVLGEASFEKSVDLVM